MRLSPRGCSAPPARRKGRVVLDLGTGNGYVAMALARAQPGCRVVGADVAARAIARGAGLSWLVERAVFG